jgi:hypothetical protein
MESLFSLVISRFRESKEDILELIEKFEPLSPKVYIYNKSEEEFKLEKEGVYIEIENIPNVGREAHTWIYHMVKMYYFLTPVLYFVPASWKNKQDEFCLKNVFGSISPFKILNAIESKIEMDFSISSWYGTHSENKKHTISQNFTLSKIRPYGKWFEERISNKIKIEKYKLSHCNGHYGVFQTTQEKIKKIPLYVLNDWLEELIEVGPNGEVPHYWERSWTSVFSY